MGVIECDRHGELGLYGIQTVSEAVATAVESRAPWSANDVVRIRCEWFPDQYPWSSVWLDRRTHGDRDDARLSFSEAYALAPSPVCSECLRLWLAQIGAKTQLPPEEERFLRLKEGLEQLFEPVWQELKNLHEAFLRVSRQPDKRGVLGGFGLNSRQGSPFQGYLRSARGYAIWIEFEDRSTELVGTVRSPSGEFAITDAVCEPLNVPLTGGELTEAAIEALTSWRGRLVAFLRLSTSAIRAP